MNRRLKIQTIAPFATRRARIAPCGFISTLPRIAAAAARKSEARNPTCLRSASTRQESDRNPKAEIRIGHIRDERNASGKRSFFDFASQLQNWPQENANDAKTRETRHFFAISAVFRGNSGVFQSGLRLRISDFDLRDAIAEIVHFGNFQHEFPLTLTLSPGEREQQRRLNRVRTVCPSLTGWRRFSLSLGERTGVRGNGPPIFAKQRTSAISSRISNVYRGSDFRLQTLFSRNAAL
jgi:hypothetical protein